MISSELSGELIKVGYPGNPEVSELIYLIGDRLHSMELILRPRRQWQVRARKDLLDNEWVISLPGETLEKALAELLLILNKKHYD